MDTSDLRLKYVLVGASGSGKTTMAGILRDVLGFRRCITFTTRPMRPGEVNGIDYHFRSSFNPKEMFEMSLFGDDLYGITWDELKKGDFIILEPQGVRYYREHYPAPLCVILLKRDNIHVDSARMARDNAAGFDDIKPDYIVTGDTIDTMATNLLSTIAQIQHITTLPLDKQICAAQAKRNCTAPENKKQDIEAEFVR